jgi:putative membrane protein
MQEIINTLVYCGIGIVLMSLGIYLIDLVIPCDFKEEIKKRNLAVGYITAGISIGVGIILKSAIMSPSLSDVTITLLDGVISTIIYFFVGILVCILGYLSMLMMNKKYNLNKEISEGNPAVGLMVMGLFIGLSIVISGVIY